MLVTGYSISGVKLLSTTAPNLLFHAQSQKDMPTLHKGLTLPSQLPLHSEPVHSGSVLLYPIAWF